MTLAQQSGSGAEQSEAQTCARRADQQPRQWEQQQVHEWAPDPPPLLLAAVARAGITSRPDTSHRGTRSVRGCPSVSPGHSSEKSERLALTDPGSPPSRPPAPKRGAFPTPKSEIDRARPYVPDVEDVEDPDASADEQHASADAEGEAEE